MQPGRLMLHHRQDIPKSQGPHQAIWGLRVGNEMISKPIALIQVPNQRLFSTKAAALYLGVHSDTLREYADRGWIRARRLGKRRVFTLEDLNAFIDSLPEYQSYDYTAPGGKPGGKEVSNGN